MDCGAHTPFMPQRLRWAHPWALDPIAQGPPIGVTSGGLPHYPPGIKKGGHESLYCWTTQGGLQTFTHLLLSGPSIVEAGLDPQS